MHQFIVSAALVILVAGCSPLQTVTAVPPVSSAALASATSTLVAATAPAPAEATATLSPAASGPVVLRVLSPLDNAVVNTPQVTVTGATAPGAVVTVNDNILVVGPDGQFHSDVTLDEGLNLIEIIASNTSGNEATVELSVTYEP